MQIVSCGFGYLRRTPAGCVHRAPSPVVCGLLLVVCADEFGVYVGILKIIYEKHCWYLNLDLSVLYLCSI